MIYTEIMIKNLFFSLGLLLMSGPAFSESAGRAVNPLIYSDVPDMSMVRVGDTYYMSSTTMHMVPGVPIMKSKDLSNWELAGYAYDTLTDSLATMNLEDGKNTYGRGSWASCIRYYNGKYYVSTFAQTTNKTYFSLRTIQKRARGNV